MDQLTTIRLPFHGCGVLCKRLLVGLLHLHTLTLVTPVALPTQPPRAVPMNPRNGGKWFHALLPALGSGTAFNAGFCYQISMLFEQLPSSNKHLPKPPLFVSG